MTYHWPAAASASPNKMAAKISVPVPWPHILEVSASPKGQRIWFRRLSSNFFFFWQLPCFGGLLNQNHLFQSWESWYSTVLNSLSHTWEWKVVWAEGVLKTNLLSTCLPYEQKSLNNVPTKNIFRGDIGCLCSHGTQRTNNFVFAWLDVLGFSSLFWISRVDISRKPSTSTELL